MSKNCYTCAWFCHTDDKCYGTADRLAGITAARKPKDAGHCRTWQGDGLEDWERDDTLMTMGKDGDHGKGEF